MILLFVPYFEGGCVINQEDILPILNKNYKRNDLLNKHDRQGEYYDQYPYVRMTHRSLDIYEWGSMPTSMNSSMLRIRSVWIELTSNPYKVH
jgi:hypothetical protein